MFLFRITSRNLLKPFKKPIKNIKNQPKNHKKNLKIYKNHIKIPKPAVDVGIKNLPKKIQKFKNYKKIIFCTF